jgi:hypothetical protein
LSSYSYSYLSDHDPLFLHLKLGVEFNDKSHRDVSLRTSWAKATDDDLNNDRSCLLPNIRHICSLTSALPCTDMCCPDLGHHAAIDLYAEAISNAC